MLGMGSRRYRFRLKQIAPYGSSRQRREPSGSLQLRRQHDCEQHNPLSRHTLRFHALGDDVHAGLLTNLVDHYRGKQGHERSCPLSPRYPIRWGPYGDLAVPHRIRIE